MDTPIERPTPCIPSPCGSNAICRESNGAGSCSCVDNYIGNPYEGCRPECTVNSDCTSDRACIRSKCQNPCPGTCGTNAICQVINHLPVCLCQSGYSGNPFTYCSRIIESRKFFVRIFNFIFNIKLCYNINDFWMNYFSDKSTFYSPSQ